MGTDFKVVLLHRDPRATINSLRKEIQEWLPGAAAPKKICGNLYQDYSTVIKLNERHFRNRILTVKYEDVVLEPYKTSMEIYQFMNATQDLKYAYEYIQSHSQNSERDQEEEGESQSAVGRQMAKAALGLSLAKRKIRLEKQWRLGQLSR